MKWHEDHPDFYYYLSNFLLKSGMIKESYEMLEKALHMDYSGHVRLLSTFSDLKINTGFTEIIEGFREGK